MPRARKVLNAFTAREVHEITGLSRYMVDYLARDGYLEPHYADGRVRGRVRYYSYRDLIIVRIIQKLLKTGLELKRLKQALQLLRKDAAWVSRDARSMELLATDGSQIYFPHRNGSLVELTPARQQTFAFVLDIAKTQDDVRSRMGARKRDLYSLENRDLQFEKPRRQRGLRRVK